MQSCKKPPFCHRNDGFVLKSARLMCDFGGWFELDDGETAYIGHGKDNYYGAGTVWLVYPERQEEYKCTDASVAEGIAKCFMQKFLTNPANH